MRPDSSRPARSAPALAMGAALILAYGAFAFTVDDTFISLRFAANWWRGLGPVFNPGERVEGFSSPLWVALLALSEAIPGDALVKAKLLGLGFHLLAFPALARAARGLGAPPAAALGYFAVTVPAVLWSVSGMEAPLCAWLWLGLWRVASGRAGLDGRGAARAWAICVAALLARPEAPLAVGLALAGPLLRRDPRARALAAAVLATGLALLAVRLGYYGHPWPNTYYAKHYQTWGHVPYTIKNYLGGFLAGPGLGLAAAGALGAGLARIPPGAPRPASPDAGWAWAFIGSQVFFCLYVGGDWMPAGRFLVPVLPLACLLAARSFAGPGAEWAAWRRLAWLPLVLHLWANIHAARDLPWAWAWAPSAHAPAALRLRVSGGNPYYAEVADWLRAGPRLDPVAVGELGFLCYYSGRTCLDLHGLCDTAIARAPGVPGSVIGKRLPLADPAFPSTQLGRYLLARAPGALAVTAGETGGLPPGLLGGRYRLARAAGNFGLYLPIGGAGTGAAAAGP